MRSADGRFSPGARRGRRLRVVVALLAFVSGAGCASSGVTFVEADARVRDEVGVEDRELRPPAPSPPPQVAPSPEPAEPVGSETEPAPVGERPADPATGGRVDGEGAAGSPPEVDPRAALERALEAGDVAAVQGFLGRVDPDGALSGGHTPLTLAARRGDAGIVRLLVERGADVDRPNREGITPVEIALRARHDAVLHVLDEAGAQFPMAAAPEPPPPGPPAPVPEEPSPPPAPPGPGAPSVDPPVAASPGPTAGLAWGNPPWFVLALLALGALFLLVAIFGAIAVSVWGKKDQVTTANEILKLAAALGLTFMMLPFPGVDVTGCTFGLGDEGASRAAASEAIARAEGPVAVPIPRFTVAAGGAVALFLIVYGVLNLRLIGAFLGQVGTFLTNLRRYILGGDDKPKG